MEVTDFIDAALSEQEQAAKEAYKEGATRIAENMKALRNALPIEAFKALSVDPDDVATGENTSEVYARGEFEVEGEKLWIQFNVRHARSTVRSVEVTLPHHQSTSIVASQDKWADNISEIGRRIAVAVQRKKEERRLAIVRKVNRLRQQIDQSIVDDPQRALANLRQVKDHITDTEEVTLPEEVRAELIDLVGQEAVKVKDLAQKRSAVAAKIVLKAQQRERDLGEYEATVRGWARDNTDRLWSPWEARLIEYTKVSANVTVGTFGDYDDEYYDPPIVELTDTMIVLPDLTEDGWMQQIDNQGRISKVSVSGVIKEKPLEFNEPTIEEALRYHRHHEVYTPGVYYHVNIPPHVEGEPSDPPEAPEPWRTYLDDIQGMEVLPSNVLTNVYGVGQYRVVESIKNILSVWL